MKVLSAHKEPGIWEPGIRDITGIGLFFFREVRLLDPEHFLMRPLGAFYGQLTHRLLVYLLLSACLLCGVFLSMALAYEPEFMVRQLPLVCTLALHLVLVFSACHVLSDVLANLLWRGRLAYAKRNVGQQWLVLLTGLILGGYLFQATLPELLSRYAPWPENSLPGLTEPGLRHLAIHLFMVPLGCAALYVHFFMAFISQRNLDQAQAPAYWLGEYEAWENPALLTLKPRPAISSRPLIFQDQGVEIVISPKNITHVSVEDHYCQIHYLAGRGAKKMMARESLQGLLLRLPADQFLQIHRSHLVNQRHVAGFKRNSGHAWALVGPDKIRLPISRRRFRELKPSLQN